MPDDQSKATEDAVREVLRRGGFHRVGFAAAARATRAPEYERWLAAGHHGVMEYLARRVQRRLNPSEVLPGAQSVIVLACHYGRRDGDQQQAAPRSTGGAPGQISLYAQGTDYHRVIEARLRSACERLKVLHPSGAFRYYVDTGPVLERHWAEQAGVGWIGKNTCCIDPDYGSYFFIGVILTTMELTPDTPLQDHCGSCQLCLDACPTDAFVGPYELDARRCISYLTIELRGEIPIELEEQMGNWIFGCDVCQDVCPYNHTAARLQDPELAPRPENRRPDLTELADLSPETFAARFPQSAVRRPKFAGLLRNVIVALSHLPWELARKTLRRLAARLDVTENTVLAATVRRALDRAERRRPD